MFIIILYTINYILILSYYLICLSNTIRVYSVYSHLSLTLFYLRLFPSILFTLYFFVSCINIIVIAEKKIPVD